MADPRTRAAALAPFRRCRDVLRAADACLAELLAAFTGEPAERTGRLSTLPPAAGFAPFAALAAPETQAASGEPAAAAAAGVRRRAGAPPAPPAPGRRPTTLAESALEGASSLAAARARSGVHSLASTAPARRSANSGPGADAPAVLPEAGRTLASTARSGAAAAAGAGNASASARSVGELIGDLLQRHAAPAARPGAGPTLARTARSGAAAAASAGNASASERSVGELIGTLLQRHAAPRPSANTPGAAQSAAAGATQARTHADALPDATSRRAAQRPAASARPTAADADASAPLQHTTDALRTLVAPLFMRPVADTGAGAAVDAQRAPGRGPLLRAPSRLLGAAAPGAQAAPAANAKAWATPAAPVSGDQPADGPADLAAGLERLLREQAWLRGVDLT